MVYIDQWKPNVPYKPNTITCRLKTLWESSRFLIHIGKYSYMKSSLKRKDIQLQQLLNRNWTDSKHSYMKSRRRTKTKKQEMMTRLIQTIGKKWTHAFTTQAWLLTILRSQSLASQGQKNTYLLNDHEEAYTSNRGMPKLIVNSNNYLPLIKSTQKRATGFTWQSKQNKRLKRTKNLIILN